MTNMGEDLNYQGVLKKLNITDSDKSHDEYKLSGVVPFSLDSTEIKRTITVFGITPETFEREYSTVEFDYAKFKETFKTFCKDFGDVLTAGVESKALEFSSKMLFDYGPYIRNEKRSKGDKAVRFRFPYVKTDSENKHYLRYKTVIVSTFKEIVYDKMVSDQKMILTFKQAGLLAMETFSKAIDFCYSNNGNVLMSPLCGAIFSRESISEIANALKIESVEVIKILNDSTTAGGQYLENSDLSCAIFAMISATKKVSDKTIRDSLIIKTVKQYLTKGKEYHVERFRVFAEHALGGVPPGMDPDTLITSFEKIQSMSASLRFRAKAIEQTKKEIIVIQPPSRDTNHA